MGKFLFSTKYTYRLTRHLLFFFLTVLIFTLIVILQGGEKHFGEVFISVILNALFFFSYAYITVYFIVPEFVLKRRYFGAILIFLLVGVGLSSIKLLSSNEIFYSSLSPQNISSKGIFNLRYIIVNTKDMSFIVAIFCIANFAKGYLYADKMRRELIERNKEAQNKLLQSQFDPHFLFNTINNLYALSLLDPRKTQLQITRFKKVLEYITEKSQKRFVKIEDELELIENYIQLEKLRYGNRLDVKFNKGQEAAGQLIPPMVFFVLVENCFEHGSSLDAGEPWISISIGVGNRRIRFTTANSIPGNGNGHKPQKEGVSITNLHNRLKILYGNNYLLKTAENGKVFKVELELIITDADSR